MRKTLIILVFIGLFMEFFQPPVNHLTTATTHEDVTALHTYLTTNETLETFFHTEDGYAPLEQDPFTLENEAHQKEVLTDVFLTMLAPTFSEALEDYYDKSVHIDLFNAEIVELARYQHEGENDKSKHYDFHVMVRLKPVSESNKPLGMDTLTLNIKPDEIKVSDFIHEDI